MDIRLELFQVDAFTDRPFRGNPAAVCLLTEPLEGRWLQAIATEMNLSETAFVQPIGNRSYDKTNNRYRLRWFTPMLEVPLCGHATIATAKVLFEEIGVQNGDIIFETLSGELIATCYSGGIALNLPIDVPEVVEAPPELMAAMGLNSCQEILLGKNTRKLVFQVADPEEVVALQPDFSRMKTAKIPYIIKGVGVTAASGKQYDFVSRYFNPWAGVDEDPVTGSVHTLLAAHWADRLGKSELRAYQASARGGEVLLRVGRQGRVELVGKAVIVLRGQLAIQL